MRRNEDMPSDLFNTTDNKTNNYGLFADAFSKSIYNNYDLISSKINRIMEVSFGIVYDLFKKYESLSDVSYSFEYNWISINNDKK